MLNIKLFFDIWQLKVEVGKLFDNIVKDLGALILESIKVEGIVDFIRHWKL